MKPTKSFSTLPESFNRIGAVWFAVAGLYALASIHSPAMFQYGQVLNLLQVAAFLGIIAIGQTFVLLVGGIDLSQAGVVTLVNILSTSIMVGKAENIVEAVILCLFVSLFVGFINGLLITIFRVTPLITTLSMNSLVYGSALVYTGGMPHGKIAPAFEFLGQGHFLGIPVTGIVWLTLAISIGYASLHTIYGRWIYAVGANPQAARLMGIPVNSVLISAYMMSSLFACLGALVLTSYIGLPSLGIGDQFLLTSIAAVVVGGTALTGGVGSVFGTIGGTLFITILSSYTRLINQPIGIQFMLQGLIIALSVLMYRLVQKNRLG
ncbi:MAG: ABC transporter permease [SAR324 cluster bacterium]|nr:ABC transporter permease [SAR324 cluster bacterium]